MSLILDALRKLERDKDAHDPGVLVVGSVPWGASSRARPFVLALVVAAVPALALVAWWLLRPTPPPAAVLPPAASPSPVASPSPEPRAPVAPPPPVAQATTLPAAPPFRLSRPPPSGPASVARPAAASPEAPGVAPTPEPAAPDLAAEPVAERLSVAPAAASGGEASPAAQPGELRLTAISRRDGRPVALINDRLVFEGDSFEGVRILRIGETEVEVEVRGERRVLRF